jgi:chromosome segregation ATPase
MSYNNILLSIIDTLKNKIQDLTISLWSMEQDIIELKSKVDYMEGEIITLKENIMYIENEYDDLHKSYNTSTNVDEYISICEEKNQLEKKYNDLQQKYDCLLENISDIEYTL